MLFMDFVILVVLVNFVILEMCLLSSLSLKKYSFLCQILYSSFCILFLKKGPPPNYTC